MEKIMRTPWREWSLRASFVAYITVFLLAALLLGGMTQLLLEKAGERVRSTYHLEEQRYYLTNHQGEQLGDGVIVYEHMPYSAEDERRLAFYERLSNSCSGIYVTLAILLATALFYRQKLKRPLAILEQASEKIMTQDLDFEIVYDKKDEMGQLCQSFEKMRQALVENHRVMWRQMEERRCLNAAFAHDLRTPLTILKGYTDLLLMEEAPSAQLVQETIQTIAVHVERLEQYTKTMSELQKLEDVSPEITRCSGADLAEALRQSAEMLCVQAKRSLDFQNQLASAEVAVDDKFLQRVWENLLSNAVRYAQSTLWAKVSESEQYVFLRVNDDGAGFTQKALEQAAWPYYTEDGETGGHQGLGLYVSRVLCEHHGGWLILFNNEQGGVVEAAFAKMAAL